jgi:hypothetical protein
MEDGMSDGKIEIDVGLANQFVINIEDIPMSISPEAARWLEEQYSKRESIVIRSVFRNDSNGFQLVLMRRRDERKLK